MQLTYNHDRKAFLINEGIEELACVDFKFSDLDHQGSVMTMEEAGGYTYAEYYKKDVKELSYRIAYLKNVGEDGGDPQRIGWMLPISMLTTEDEETLAKDHVNQYVFFAYCYLLGKEAIQYELINGKELDVILTETYPDGCLLIVNNANIPAAVTLKMLELSLARNGYFASATGYANPLINDEGNLNLTPAGEIQKADGSYIDPYIEEFLRKYSYNRNTFIRFLYLYQVEEVLMNTEMVSQLEDFLYLLKQNKPNYRKVENGLKETTESKRLKQIVENAHLQSTIINALDQKCNEFLNSEGDNPLVQPESIYQVRNHIVHRFRVASGDENAVKDICDHLELYLYDLLICYKLPKVNRPVPAA